MAKKEQTNNGRTEYFVHPAEPKVYLALMQDLSAGQFDNTFNTNPDVAKIIVNKEKLTTYKLLNQEVATEFFNKIEDTSEKFKVDLTIYHKAGDSAQAEIFVPTASKPVT